MCEHYLACAAAGRETNVCQFEVAGQLLESCEVDDLHCRNEVLLHVAALTIYSPTNYSFPDNYCVWPISARFPDVLRLFSASDYDKAAGMFAEVAQEAQEYNCHPMFHYVEGLIDEARGQTEAALEAYSASITWGGVYFSPALFSRGLLLGELGRRVEASYDAASLSTFLNVAAPVVLPTMAALTENYPLDESQFASWVAHPVMYRLSSPGSEQYSDLTDEEPTPVGIATHPINSDLVIYEFIGSSFWYSPPLRSALRLRHLASLTGTDLFGSGIAAVTVDGFAYDEHYANEYLRLYINPEFIIAYEANDTYILLPAGEPDPRPELGPRWCESGVISFIRPGMWVTPLQMRGEMAFRPAPGNETEGKVAEVSGARVLGEPACVGDTTWWYVRNRNGYVGWTPENDGHGYLIGPAQPSNRLVLYCPSALPHRLFTDGKARVTQAPGAGLLREAPGHDAALLRRLAPGQIVNVGSERICVDGQVWWRVRTEDSEISGYMAEGDADTYFLELALDSP